MGVAASTAALSSQLPASSSLGSGTGVAGASGQASRIFPAADLATMQAPSGMGQPAAATQPASPSPAGQLQPQDVFDTVAPIPVAQENLYTFVGFAGPEHARHVCGSKNILAMPKTSEQRQALFASIQAALTKGSMSTTWPENTIWLAARWSSVDGQWRWDDGTTVDQPIDWAVYEPSAENNQQQEPWLSMAQNGKVCDTDPQHSFGVFCQNAPNGIGDAMISGAKDARGAGKVQGLNLGKVATGTTEDIAVPTETNSWSTINVHMHMPMVQEFSIPTGGKAPTVRRVKLLDFNGSVLTSATVVVLVVAGLSMSLMIVQRFRSGTCSRAASRGVGAGHNRLSAYAQLREALQERSQASMVLSTEADTA